MQYCKRNRKKNVFCSQVPLEFFLLYRHFSLVPHGSTRQSELFLITIAKRCVHALFHALACDFAKPRMEKSKNFANVRMEDSSDFAFTRMEECCDFRSNENGRKLVFRISQNCEKMERKLGFRICKNHSIVSKM